MKYWGTHFCLNGQGERSLRYTGTDPKLRIFQLGCRHYFLQARRPREVIKTKQVHSSGYSRADREASIPGQKTPPRHGFRVAPPGSLPPRPQHRGVRVTSSRRLAAPGPAFWGRRPPPSPPRARAHQVALSSMSTQRPPTRPTAAGGAEPEVALSGSPSSESRLSSLGVWRYPHLYGLDSDERSGGKERGRRPAG